MGEREELSKIKKDDNREMRKEKEAGKQGERALGAEMLHCLCGLPPRIIEHPLTDECRRAH